MTEITRIRLRSSTAPIEFPYAVAYLVPLNRMHEVYRIFGPCYSAPFTQKAKNLVQRTSFDHGTYKVPDEDVRVVVPLRDAREGRIKPFTSRRVRTKLQPKDTATDADKRAFRTQLDANIISEQTLFHLGPNPEDAKQVCLLCPQLLQHVMGACVPGERQCAEQLQVPVDTLLRVARRPLRRATDV